MREITYWLSIKGRATVFIDRLICSEDFLYFVVVILFFPNVGNHEDRGSPGKTESSDDGRTLSCCDCSYRGIGYMTSRPTFFMVL